jgi:NitT/TauT family transport system substrate-binding protein
VTDHSESGSAFRSKKYTSFSAIVEDITAGNLKASFILAPLAMVMNRKGTPVKIVHLGHRDGTTMMVRTDSSVWSFAGLKGKRIAIPHRYSNQRILVERLKEQFGFGPNDLTLVDYPPPEMPAALKTGQIDAYVVGEPFPAKAEMDGFGRVLYYTKDIWPNFISCVLVVHEDLIRENRPLVEELVRGIARSGRWIDEPGEDLAAGVVEEKDAPPPGSPGRDGLTILREGFGRTHRMQAAAIAARKNYYAQDPELLKFVLSHPPDRVRYSNLIPARPDFEEIQKYAERLGYFSFRPVTPEDPFGFDDYCDPTFAVAAPAAATATR